MSPKILIIAEAGVNHNGDLALARKLIDAARDAGADIVKFQSFSADRLVTRTARKASYQLKAGHPSESQYQMLKKLELTELMHRELISYCNDRGIKFLSTAFDVENIDLLNRLGQPFFKIPSGELTNLPYLRHIGGLQKTVLLSTGMATLWEVESSIRILEQAGTSRKNITALHCTSEYPAPMCEVNLAAMKSMSDYLGVAVGYSDHTQGIEVAIAAVALGATVIEKHFTLDRGLPGPDHKASLEPSELHSMVAAIRNIELALGDGVKSCKPSESENRLLVRKSLVACKAIKAGAIFTSENLTTKRPGTGISPMLWDEFIGKVASRDYEVDDPIQS